MEDTSAPRAEVPAFGNAIPDVSPPEAVTETDVVASARAAEAPIVGAQETKPSVAKSTPKAAPAKAAPPPVEPVAEVETEAEEAPAAEETETTEEETKKSGEEATANELEAWKKQAEKFGYTVDPRGKVWNSERHKFRKEKEDARAELASQESRIRQELDAKFSELARREAPVTALTKALEAGDFDAIAAAVGLKDWQTLQQEALAQASDPAYKRLRALEREKEENAARAAQQQEALRQQQAQQQRTEALRQYKTELQTKMQSSPEPLLKALHWDPVLTNEITAMQQAAWLKDGTQLTAEQIVRRNPHIATHHKRMYEALKAVFEPKSAAVPAPAKESETAAAAPKAPAKQRPVSVPASGSVTPSAAKKIDPQSDAWFEQWAAVAREKQEAAARKR